MGQVCSTHGGEQEAYRILVGKPEGKSQLGRRRCRWEESIKMGHIEIR
jgi:hypothetical protein